MKRFATGTALVLLLGVTACDKLSPQLPVFGPSRAVKDLFKIDNLNANRDYLEQKIGPPKYTDGDSHTYIVDGCKVEISYDDNQSVDSLGLLEISNRCTFNFDEFFPNRGIGNIASTSFGELTKKLPFSRFFPGCVQGCGNSVDPFIEATFSGNRSDQFLDVLAGNSYPYRGSAVKSGISAISDASDASMSKRMTDLSYVLGCDPKIQSLAKEAFKSAQIKSITIGWNLDLDPIRCAREKSEK